MRGGSRGCAPADGPKTAGAGGPAAPSGRRGGLGGGAEVSLGGGAQGAALAASSSPFAAHHT